jgi:peptide/nickel transport system substrate-binding protein
MYLGMKKIFIPLAASALLFSLASCTSCSDEKKDNHGATEAKGGVYTGGVMRMNEVEAFRSLNPIAVNEITSFHIGSQLFEGLVKFNQNDLSLQPAIASRWDINQDQTEWTFHLRPNVMFHPDPCFADGKGRALTASDVKFCFDKLCTADPNNAQFDVTFKNRVVGANESFDASKTGKSPGVSGIKATNDSTLVITLKSPFAGFLNVLAMPGCWVYPKEASDKYGIDLRTHPVGTGPFLLETMKEGEVLIMKKNPDYYGVDKDGNKLPYLDGVKFSFIREKKAEILEFKSGNLDMVYRLPVEIFHEIMGDLENAKDRKTDFQIINSPALNTSCIGFNCTAAAFNKKEVRLAFNYAIDRHRIADFTIQGEGTSADYGIVPYVKSFEDAGYNFKGIKGYTFDPVKAKNYLKQAGYPDGKGFPKVTLQINSGGGDRNILVAEVIQKMLKENLNIDVDINTTPLSEHIESMISGKSDMFRFSWVADYPEPETFLTLFYGKHVPSNPSEKSFINYFRFKNEKFDALFEESFKESDKAKRFAILSQAEQIVLDEAPFMPIFYDENFRLEQLNVRNFPENAMNYMDLSVVYMIPKDKMPKK